MTVTNKGFLDRGIISTYKNQEDEFIENTFSRRYAQRPISQLAYDQFLTNRDNNIQDLELKFKGRYSLKTFTIIEDHSSNIIHKYLCRYAIRKGVLGKTSSLAYKILDSTQKALKSSSSDKFMALQKIESIVAYEKTLQFYENTDQLFNSLLTPQEKRIDKKIPTLHKTSLDEECLLPKIDQLQIDEANEKLNFVKESEKTDSITENNDESFIISEFKALFYKNLKNAEIKKESKQLLQNMIEFYNEIVKKAVKEQKIEKEFKKLIKNATKKYSTEKEAEHLIQYTIKKYNIEEKKVIIECENKKELEQLLQNMIEEYTSVAKK